GSVKIGERIIVEPIRTGAVALVGKGVEFGGEGAELLDELECGWDTEVNARQKSGLVEFGFIEFFHQREGESKRRGWTWKPTSSASSGCFRKLLRNARRTGRGICLSSQSPLFRNQTLQ